MGAGEEDEDGEGWSLAYPLNSTFQPLPPCSPQLFSSCPSLSRVVWGRARAGSGDRDEREGRGRNEKGQEELGRVEEGARWRQEGQEGHRR